MVYLDLLSQAEAAEQAKNEKMKQILEEVMTSMGHGHAFHGGPTILFATTTPGFGQFLFNPFQPLAEKQKCN